mmetsp:Transcript_22741/g.70653  ORF Transcript_22741/g.70653 Transcript_22741/m.70653 type:complete len:251 (+) Transcript_22741:443-1195(+)
MPLGHRRRVVPANRGEQGDQHGPVQAQPGGRRAQAAGRQEALPQLRGGGVGDARGLLAEQRRGHRPPRRCVPPQPRSHRGVRALRGQQDHVPRLRSQGHAADGSRPRPRDGGVPAGPRAHPRGELGVLALRRAHGHAGRAQRHGERAVPRADPQDLPQAQPAPPLPRGAPVGAGLLLRRDARDHPHGPRPAPRRGARVRVRVPDDDEHGHPRRAPGHPPLPERQPLWVHGRTAVRGRQAIAVLRGGRDAA